MDFSEALILLLITGSAVKPAAYFAAEAPHLPISDRRWIALTSVAIQAVVLTIFAAFGANILEFFHVSVSALEVAGGLILLLFAISLVLGEDHSETEGAPRGGRGMAVYPLAMPLLASPQAIVVVTIISTQLGFGNRALLWAALATVLVFNIVVMMAVAQVIGGKKEGKATGLSVAPILLRIVALLLAGLAVEIMALGLRGYGVLGPMPGAAASH